MQLRDWATADRFAKQALIAEPDDPELLTSAAKIAALSGQKREAARLLTHAAKAAGYLPSSRVDFAVQALIDVGELYAAIDLLNESLAANGDNTTHRKMLIGFLGEAQRTELIPPHLKRLIQNRAFDVQLLLAVTETSSRRFSFNTAKILLERNPDDHRVRLGDALELLDKHDAIACETMLREILEHHPKFAPAYALLGQTLMEQRRIDEIPAWADAAPVDCREHADYWLTIGDWAASFDKHQQAARAYWEATRRDPNDSNAWIRLSQALRSVRSSQAVDDSNAVSDAQLHAIEARIERLLKLRAHYYDFTWEGKDRQANAVAIADDLFALGRTWEAEAWTAVATTMKKEPTSRLGELRKEVLARLSKDPSWISPIDQPSLALDLSPWPEPTLQSPNQQPSKSTGIAPRLASHDHLLMRDESETWQLDGVGAKNNPDNAKLAALIRSTGVGGGAIDFDLDGWPDALVMGAGGTMLKSDSMANELLRNLGDRFIKVTAMTGTGDRGYGQGVAIGDFNEDGFADLFFANLGKNKLLRNNGDGSFSDCTELLDDGQWQEWSTCGAFVDMNRDGITDLLTTNYCRTIANMDKACPDANGVPGPCHPLKFPAHRDQFFVGKGDGSLQDVSDTWIGDVTPGRGLGIVAGALDGRQIGAFVANDMTPNAFYRYLGSADQRLDENATVSGLAVDGRTIAQASMGIACSDFDGDGDLDFYVTGFGREYNILYDQVAPGLWQDITNKLDLVQSTLPMVGFGTEAIDLDADGIDEILVTNGHIGDFNEPDSLPYEQPLQVFRRGASGSFQWVDDDRWGDYFRQSHVGRALWTIDVNRDGHSDVMITHSYEQMRLLVNHTKSDADRIAFQLVGTDDSRGAVGAIIRFVCNGRQRSLWALAGGGYLCTNENILRAGLGQADEVTDVTVTWPNGDTQSLGTLPSNQLYLIVQGDGLPFVMDEYAAAGKD
ncbi:FG-GAP-like repeat-containing protein [Stieleria varia]|nr:FG-GAP-like repeat-containing protein [Stieleria varia]